MVSNFLPRTLPDGVGSLRIQCTLVGVFDLLFLACIYLSPIASHIHLTSAIVWIIAPAILLIIGAAIKSLHCMWPWMMNNFAVAYFLLFFSLEEILGNINIIVDTIESQSSDGNAFHVHMGPWIIFFVLIFLFSRLDVVVRFMRKLYVTSIREQVHCDCLITNEVKTITV